MNHFYWVSVYVFAYVLSFIVHSVIGEHNTISVYEGHKASLTFIYYFNDTEPINYNLKIGDRQPFRENGRIRSEGMNADQHRRMRVLEEQIDQNMKIIQVIFQKTKRGDAGTYICTFYRDGHIESFETISLVVRFCPGKAKCEWSKITSNGWHTLHCQARGGSPPGNIKCIQNDRGAPLKGCLQNEGLQKEGNSTDVYLLRTFWAIKTEPIHCCAQNELDDHETCGDFSWFPPEKPTLQSELSMNDISNSTNYQNTNVTQLSSTEYNKPWTEYTLSIVFLTLSISIPIFISVAFIVYCIWNQHGRRQEKKPKRDKANPSVSV